MHSVVPRQTLARAPTHVDKRAPAGQREAAGAVRRGLAGVHGGVAGVGHQRPDAILVAGGAHGAQGAALDAGRRRSAGLSDGGGGHRQAPRFGGRLAGRYSELHPFRAVAEGRAAGQERLQRAGRVCKGRRSGLQGASAGSVAREMPLVTRERVGCTLASRLRQAVRATDATHVRAPTATLHEPFALQTSLIACWDRQQRQCLTPQRRPGCPAACSKAAVQQRRTGSNKRRGHWAARGCPAACSGSGGGRRRLRQRRRRRQQAASRCGRRWRRTW